MSANQDYAIIEHHINLVPDKLGIRRKTIDVAGSRVYVDTTRSDVYLDKVYIGVDEKGAVPVSLTRVIDVYPNTFSRINIEWTGENDYKTLVLIVTRASAKIQVPQPVDVMSIRGDIARESTLSSIRDILANLAGRISWDRNAVWIYGEAITAPPANTVLVSKNVATGKKCYIYGLYISASEANTFILTWVSNGVERSIMIPLSGAGAVMAVLEVALNEGLPADGGSITIRNVQAGAGVYQAGILVLEV